MVFPKNNLPTDSQPWTRDVEKRVENLESSFRSAEVNNVTRDSQTLSQIRRLDAAVTDAAQAAAEAQAAINGLTSLGTDGSTYNINAGNISGGTITGVNFNTTGASESIDISAGKINFYEGPTFVASVSGDTFGGNPVFAISSEVTGSGAGFFMGTEDVAIGGNGASIQLGITPNTIDIASTGGYNIWGDLEVDGYIYAANNYVLTGGGDVLTSGGGVFLNGGGIYTSGGSIYPEAGNIYADNYYIYGATGNAIFNGYVLAYGSLTTNSTLQRSGLAGGGTTACNITDGGFFVRATSSERYKQDIEDVTYDYDSIINLKPKTFRLKEEVSQNENAIRYPGLIAEELAGTPLDIFVSYETLEDGTKRPDGIRYPELTSALISALKHQDSVIKNLEERVSALENG